MSRSCALIGGASRSPALLDPDCLGGAGGCGLKIKNPPTPPPIKSKTHNPSTNGKRDLFCGTKLTSDIPGKLLSPTVAIPLRRNCADSEPAAILGDMVEAS